MLGDSVIPLPHIYGARIKGVEVFCPLDPPPPYEAIAESSTSAVTQVHSEDRENTDVENHILLCYKNKLKCILLGFYVIDQNKVAHNCKGGRICLTMTTISCALKGTN